MQRIGVYEDFESTTFINLAYLNFEIEMKFMKPWVSLAASIPSESDDERQVIYVFSLIPRKGIENFLFLFTIKKMLLNVLPTAMASCPSMLRIFVTP
jgi:hypothetical protein